MDTQSISVVDIVAVLIIIIGTLLGLRRGLTGQIPFLLGTTALVLALTKGFVPLQSWLGERFGLADLHAILLALALIVALPFVLVWIYRRLPVAVTKVTFMSWADRLGGALAGLIGATAFVVLAFMLLHLIPAAYRPDAIDGDSQLKRCLTDVEKVISRKVSTEIKDIRREIQETREKRAQKRLQWE